jgi:hypothetical protein
MIKLIMAQKNPHIKVENTTRIEYKILALFLSTCFDISMQEIYKRTCRLHNKYNKEACTETNPDFQTYIHVGRNFDHESILYFEDEHNNLATYILKMSTIT